MFLASIQRRHAAWSVLFGLASGLAIPGKSCAGLIVLACVLATLPHPSGDRNGARRALILLPRSVRLYSRPISIGLSSTIPFRSGCMSLRSGRLTGHSTVIVHALSFVGAYVALSSTALVAFWLCLRPWNAAMTRSVVADWHGARAVVACIAFAPVAPP